MPPISDAMACAEQSKEQMYWPEILRLNAEIRRLNGEHNKDEFEKGIAKSIEMARRQEAKLWELRSTMSLSRHFASTERRDEACAMMSGICQWYDGAASTPDLGDARALCDELRLG